MGRELTLAPSCPRLPPRVRRRTSRGPGWLWPSALDVPKCPASHRTRACTGCSHAKRTKGSRASTESPSPARLRAGGGRQECGPLRRRKSQVPGTPVLRVAHSGLARGVCDLDAVLCSSATVGGLPEHQCLGCFKHGFFLGHQATDVVPALLNRQGSGLQVVEYMLVVRDFGRLFQVEFLGHDLEVDD